MTNVIANGTSTVYIDESGGNIRYQIDTGTINTISIWPVTFTNLTPATTLKVIFRTGITIDSPLKYFVCGSNNIQFGSTTLNSDGSRPVITINTANWEGFIVNGNGLSVGENGFNNIYVYNIHVDGTGYTLQIGGGWVGKQFFGNRATENYIVNCSSAGNMSDKSGGILGSNSGAGVGSTLYIRGCSSTGTMSQLSGGILGEYAGSNGGSVTCEQCYSEGTIQGFAGGIFGDYAGSGGSVLATNCYSMGTIGNSAGGIYGRYAGNAGSAVAESCYSRGNATTDGGGIYGIGAGSTAGFTLATNCYSSGIITTSGRGIYGTGRVVGTETRCYVANGSWNSGSAQTSLSGAPAETVSAGETWISTGLNLPYELNGMGYSPYTLDVITGSSTLNQTFSQTIQAGQTSTAALSADASGNSFTILNRTGGDSNSYGTITMSNQTGAITTTSATAPGTYTITLRSVGSYHTTQFILTVVAAGATATTTINYYALDPNQLKNDTYEELTQFKMGIFVLQQRQYNPNMRFSSYADYMRFKAVQNVVKPA